MKNSDDLILLTNLENDQEASVVSITTELKSAKRLADVGLTPGTAIKVIRKTMFCGPIEVSVRGTHLALGRGISSQVVTRAKSKNGKP